MTPLESIMADERLAGLDFAYNDAVHDLFAERYLQPLVEEMNKEFGVNHRMVMIGGGGITGSDTTSIKIWRPREKGSGFWSKVVRFFLPYKCVISVSLLNGSVTLKDKRYRKFANQIVQITDLGWRG